MDKLEKFIADNLAELDPAWDPGTAPLDPSRFPQSSTEKPSRWRLWTLLTVLLIITSSVLGYRIALVTSTTDASMVEAMDIKNHYSVQVANVAASSDYAQRLTEEDRELLSQLMVQLDHEADLILADLQNGLDQDVLLERLSLNYQKRLQLLESIISSPSRQSENNERVYM